MVLAFAGAAVVVGAVFFVGNGTRYRFPDDRRDSTRPSAEASAESREDAAPASDVEAAAPAETAAPAAPVPDYDSFPRGRATVRLVESGSRAPMAGVAIVFDREPVGPGSPSERATSDSAGEIALEDLPVGRWHARADDDFLLLHPQRTFADVVPGGDPWPTTMTVVRGALVTGAVVDRRGGPVGGVAVSLAIDMPAMARTSSAEGYSIASHHTFDKSRLAATTGADGRFAIRAVPPGTIFVVFATHPRFAPFSLEGFEPRAGEIAAVPPIVLGEGGTIRVIASAEGEPVEGARVYVNGGGARRPNDEPGAAAAATGPDGAVSVPLLRAGTYEVSVVADGFAPFVRRDLEVADERTEEIAAALVEGLALAGVVVDAKNAPVPGAAVEARLPLNWRKVTADAAGRFRIDGLEGEDARVRVTAEGFASKVCRVELVPEDVRITLSRESSVAGRVVDRGGNPVAAFRLTVDPVVDPFSDERPTHAVFPVNDPEGRFVAPKLLAGEYRFRADASERGLGSGESEVVEVADGAAVEGVRIEVEPTFRVLARVVDATTQEPVSGVFVHWTDVAPGGDAEESDWRRPRGRANVTGDDGVIDVDVPERIRALRFVERRHLERTIEPVPSPGDGSRVEIAVALARGGTIAGTVRDAAGAPLAGARITAVLANGDYLSAHTPSDGSYAISGLVPGDHTVGQEREGGGAFVDFVPVTIVGEETVRVDFGPGVRPGSLVSGRVLAGDAPVAGAEVSLTRAETSLPLGAIADDRGAFAFAAVSAGEWTVSTEIARTPVSRTVVVDGESPVPVDLVLPTGGLSVAVSDAETGQPLSGIFVAFEGDEGGDESLTDEGGLAEFERLPAGPAIVHVGGAPWWNENDRPDYAAQRLETTIPDRGTASLAVKLERGLVLEGKVTGADGRPAKEPKVLLRSADGIDVVSRGDYRMAEAGRYRVERLAPGTYVAVVSARGEATLVVPGVRVDAHGPSVADFALPRGGAVRVSVVDRRGGAVRFVPYVSCETADGIPVSLGQPFISGGEAEFLLAPGAYVFEAMSSRAEVTVAAGETAHATLTLD